MVIADILDINN